MQTRNATRLRSPWHSGYPILSTRASSSESRSFPPSRAEALTESSSTRLTCFCLSLEYTRIIPTVNVHTANSRNKMKQWIDRWAAEKKRRKDAKLPRIVPFRSLNYW